MKGHDASDFVINVFLFSIAKGGDFSILNDSGYISVFSLYTDLAFRKEGILAIEFQTGVPFIRDLVLYDTGITKDSYFELNDIEKTSWNRDGGILKIKFKGSSAIYVYNINEGSFSKRFGRFVQLAKINLGHYAARNGLEYVSRIALDVIGITNNSFMRSSDKRNHLELGWNVVDNQFENRKFTFDNRFARNQTSRYNQIPITITENATTGNTEIGVGTRLALVVEGVSSVGVKNESRSVADFLKAQADRVAELRHYLNHSLVADALLKFERQISVVFGYDKNFYDYLGLDKVATLSIAPDSYDAIEGAGYDLLSEKIKAAKFTTSNFYEASCRELFK